LRKFQGAKRVVLVKSGKGVVERRLQHARKDTGCCNVRHLPGSRAACALVRARYLKILKILAPLGWEIQKEESVVSFIKNRCSIVALEQPPVGESTAQCRRNFQYQW
jgi:hypothetical protein